MRKQPGRRFIDDFEIATWPESGRALRWVETEGFQSLRSGPLIFPMPKEDRAREVQILLAGGERFRQPVQTGDNVLVKAVVSAR